MDYIKSFKLFKEGWVSDKINELDGESKVLLKSFTDPYKEMGKYLTKWKDGVGSEEIKSDILKSIKKSFDDLISNLNGVSSNSEVGDEMYDNLVTSLVYIKDTLKKELRNYISESKIFEMDSVEYSGYEIIISKIFDTLIDALKRGKADYKSISGVNIKDKVKSIIKFFNDIHTEIEKSIDSLDIKKLMNTNKSKYAESGGYKVDQVIKYKTDRYDDNKDPSQQPEMVAVGKIKSIVGDIVTIYNKKLNKMISKSVGDIIGIYQKNVYLINDEIKKKLNDYKSDEEKMDKILKIINNVDDPNIERIIKDLK